MAWVPESSRSLSDHSEGQTQATNLTACIYTLRIHGEYKGRPTAVELFCKKKNKVM